MLRIINTGLSDYGIKPPDYSRFSCFPATVYAADEGGLCAVLYYKAGERDMLVLGIDILKETQGLDIADALLRAAANIELARGDIKVSFAKAARGCFKNADIAERSAEELLATRSCGKGKAT